MGLSCFKLTPSVEATINSLKNYYPQYTDNDIIAIMRATADQYSIPEPSLQDVKRYQASKPKNPTNNIKEVTRKEMQAIKERAIADGTFMLAPNGKPTNLTERQWLQVRTKAFKRWFGDWEKAAVESEAINAYKESKDRLYLLGKEANLFFKNIKDRDKIDNLVNEFFSDIEKAGNDYNMLEMLQDSIQHQLGVTEEEALDLIAALQNAQYYIQSGDTKYLVHTNASKVVDENGEPLVVYTGTPVKGITKFSLNTENRASLTSELKKGIYFSDKNTASLYTKGKPVYKTTDKVNEQQAKRINELYWAGESLSEDWVSEYVGLPINVIDEYIKNNTEEVTGELNAVDIPEGEVIAAFLNIREPVYVNANNKTISHLSSEDKNRINSSEGAIVEHVDEHTRDDFSITDSTDYIVFDPNQIKSAENNNGGFSESTDINEDIDTETHIFTFEDGTEVTTPFIPNDQQAYALNQIDKFIKSDETTMTLSGYAGTGKTSLMEIIAAKLQNSFHNIVFTATTNKATAVLKDRVKKLGYNAVTLNKAFGIGVEVNGNSQTYNAKDLETIRNEVKIPPFSVVVIDEASMINEENYKILNEIAKSNNLKIIYLGDEAQLSPVNETDISKVFRNSEGKVIRLTKVERTGDNAILKEATALRSGQSLSGESSFNVQGQGVAYIKPNNWSKVRDIIHRFVPQLRTDPNYFRVLAYTNDTVAKYNDAIRRELGYTSYIPEINEPIVGYNNWGYIGGRRNSATYRFVNSESYTVKKVGSQRPLSYILSNGQVVNVSATPITIEDSMGTQDTINFIDVKGNKDNRDSVKIIAKEKSRLWSLYRSGSVDKRMVIAEINKIENLLFINDDVVDESVRDSKGNPVTLQTKVYDFGYAMTVHKSQGSTFTNVLLDAVDIASGTSHSTTKNLKQQLEYVGVSRATDTVTIISDNVKVEGSPIAIIPVTPSSENNQLPSGLTKEQVAGISAETQKLTDIIKNSLKSVERENLRSKDAVPTALTQTPIGTKLPVTGVLEAIVNDANSTKQEKALAIALIPVFAKTKLSVDFADLGQVAGRVEHLGTEIVSITLNPNSFKFKRQSAKVALHELVHSLTISRIASDSVFKEDVNKLINDVKDFLKDKNIPDTTTYIINGKEFKLPFDIYGLTSEAEFVAEAMSNESFQKLLAEVPVKEKSAFQKFVDAVVETFRRLFKTTYNDSASVLNRIVPMVADTIAVTANNNLVDFAGISSTNWQKERTEDQLKDAANIMQALEDAYANASRQQIQELADKFPIQKHVGNWTRQEAQNNPRILYVFTDNTDRDSGSGLIPSDSWYSKKYGEGHHYPTMTAAVVRGLENARPISTQRWYHQGAKGPAGRWTDANVEEFKHVIRAELEDIVAEFNTGKYDTIMFPDGDGLFNTSISNITKERTPELYNALSELLNEYGFGKLVPKEASKTINIWAGNNENTELSNFAHRPFTYKVRATDDIYQKFQSVEQAFQYIKAYSFADTRANDAIARGGKDILDEIKETTDGAKLRQLGKSVKGLNVEAWDRQKYAIMKGLIKASFEQNPEAKQKLLATGDATLTHNQDTTDWKTEFPRILMEIRDELRNESLSNFNPNEGATAQYGVELSANSEDMWGKIKNGWQKEHPTGIVAYRKYGDSNKSFSANAVSEGWIGNPFSTESKDASTVDKFFKWLTTGETFGESRANESFRQAIIQKILATPENAPILYYTDLGRPSHATAIGYLVQHKELLQNTSSAAQRPAEPVIPKVVKAPVPEEVPIDGFNMPNVNRAQFDEEVLRKLGSVTKKKARVELIATSFSQVVDMLIEEDEEANNRKVTNRKQFIIDNLSKILGTQNYKGVLPEMFELAGDDELQAEFDKFNYAKSPGVWMALLEEASPIIQAVEDIVIELRNQNDKEDDRNEEDWEATGENILSLRDGWMIRARELDLYENLSVKTRKLLARIKLAMKYDADGEPIVERDDLGFFRYLNPDYAHLRLLTELHKATDAKNFFELLNKMQEKDPWVKEVIDALNNDEILKSAFYSDLRKEFISYWVHTSNRRGDVQTVEVNKEPTVQYLFNDWMHNYDSHIILSKISVYNKDGGAIRENGKKVSDACQDIENKLNNVDFTLSNPKDIVDDLQEVFAAVGIKLSIEEIERSINQRGIGESIEERSEAKKEFIRKLTGQIAIIGNKIFENGLNKSPFTEFKTAYTTIAELLDLIPEGVTMSSFREGGKSYQSFSNPSWLGRLVTGINGENGEAFIENQYGGFRQYKIGNKWRSPWLAMMMDSKNGAKYRKLFARKVVLHSDHAEYDKWSSADYLGIMLNQFLATNDKNSANYFLPILADAPSAEFIRFVRFSDKNYKDTIINHLYQVFEQEVERMWLISEREKNNAEKLQNFDSDDSKKFLFFPRLNDADENGTLKGQPGYVDGTNFYKAFLKAREDDKKSRESSSPTVKARNLAETAIRNEMEAGLAEFLEEAERYGYNVRNNDTLENFYYNSALAYTQLVTLTTSDLAYYKGVTDFQKRFKEVYAMTQRINTEATWEKKPVFTKRDEKGRAYESVITLKDIVLVSKVMPEITAVLDKQVESGKMTKLEKDYIISQFKKVNATDAQAWRSLDSYREIMIGTGKWDENMQRAYEHLNSPNQESWTVEDFNIMWLTLKPFLFSLSSVDSEVTLPDGTEYGKIPCPKQFKNSEMLLLSLYGKIAMKESESPFLKAIGRVFNGEATLGTTVDLVQFESTEKVGGQAAINLNGYIKDGFIHIIDTKTKKEVEKIKFDGKYTDGEDIIENEDAILTVFKSKCIKDDAVYERAVKKVSIDDYGIQVTSPEHLLDHEGIIQSQFKKHIAANLPSDFMCKIHGKDFNGDAVYTAIQQILTENIIEGFEECTKLFGSKEAVEKELQRQMAGNQRYTAEDKKACTLVQKPDGTKDWALPLFDPIQSQRIQSLLLSVVKKKVVNPEMKRSYLVQATGVGFSKNLHIRYYDVNGDFIFNEAEFTGEEACRPKFRKLLKEKQNKYETYEAYKKATIKDSNAIAYHEIAMPLYSKELMEYCRKDDNTFDINLLDDSLREAIGLRSPNEAKYSTQPVYIKYLLPVTNGSIVMYPNEITTIVGADFDYDKIMMYFRDFYTSAVGSYNRLSEKDKAAWENQDASYEKLINDIFGVMSNSKEDGKDVFKPEDITKQSGYKKWLGYMRENYPEEYRKMMRPSVVKYNPEESIAKLNHKQRNTMFIDLAYAVLTNPSVAGQMHSPGNFDILKQQVKVKRVLKNVTFDQLAKALNLTKEVNEKREDFKRRVYETLDRTDDDKLKEILQKFSKTLDPKSVSTQLYFHRQNSNASNMIGIYAVAGGSHSLLQHTNTTIPETFIMGRKISKIDPMYDLSGKLLSKNIEQFLAASVDDVKDPVLSDLMQNPDTANITNGLIRMGFPISVATSIVVAKNYGVRTQDLEDNKEQIVDWELMELIQLQSQDNLTAAEHSESVLNGHKENDRLTQGERLRLNELMIKLENTLNVVEPLCNNLQTLTLALRYDAPNNAAGPTLGHVLARFIKYCLAAKRLAVSPIKSDAFDHTKVIGNAITIETTESGGTKAVIDWNAAVDSAFNSGYEAAQMRENAYSNPIPFIQAATKAGMIGPMTLMAQYFPQMNPAIVKILVNPESGFTKYINFENLSMDKAASTLNKVINEFLLYTLNDTPFFGTTSTITGEAVKNQENSGYFMLTFPDQILKYLTENPELRENNRFLANLEFPIKNGIRMIEFRDAKDLSKDEKMRITDSWSELAMSDNATVRNLASLLFKYGSFMGLTYSGPNSFIHLAPSVLRNAIVDYKTGLNTALSVRTSAYVEPFVEQFIRNNYNTAGLRKVSTRSVQNYTEGATEIYITALDSIKSGTDIILNNGSLDEVATYEKAILLSHKTDAGWVNELFVIDSYVIDNNNEVAGVKYRKAPTLGINGFKEYYNGLINPKSVLDVYNRKVYEAIPEEQPSNYNEDAPINNGKDEDIPLNTGSTIIPNQSGAEQQEVLQPAEAKDPATDESICNYIPGNGEGFISSGISV